MDYVVDASVTAQFIVPDQLTAYADALFAQLGDTLKLHIPEFGLLECANVIWKQVRYGNLTTNEAETLVVDLAALPLIIVSSSALLKRSLQIGLSNQLAVYDSAYIALAEMLRCPLITADSKQGTAAKSVGVQLKPLTDFAP